MNTSLLPLVSRLKKLNITIELVDNDLKINAPEGALTPELLFELKKNKKDIGDFFRLARQQMKAVYTAVEPAAEKEHYTLSSAQKRLYVLQQMEPGNISYNMPEVLLLEKGGSEKLLEDTFKKLIARHESLRTSFGMLGEKPVQKIHAITEVEFTVEHYSIEGEVEQTSRTDKEIETIIEKFIRPFDLSRPPLIRVGLVTVKSSFQLLLLDLHHIVTDGVSQDILKREFMTLYTGKELAHLALQYKDYSEWQNSPAVQEVFRQQKAFWLQEFSQDIPRLNLPIDFARPPVQSFEGSAARLELSPEETRLLYALTRSTQSTLFNVLMALYNVFLAKISGQEDIVVGTPMAGRRHPDLEQIIGVFINTLGLRYYPCGGKPFTVFLGEVKEKTLEALENQDYPFEDLVEEVALERDMSRNPLFDVMFVLESSITPPPHPPKVAKELSTSPIKPYPFENKTAKLDLTLYALETRDKLVFTFEYCTRLFRKETIANFLDYLHRVTLTVLHEPAIKLSGIEIISQQEKARILSDFNATDTLFPKDKTLPQLFEEQAARVPDRVAVVGAKHGQWGIVEQLTYRELDQSAGRLAKVLQIKGVTPGSIVAIMVERSLEMIIGIFGVIKVGGAYLPIDPQYPQERIDFMLKDSNVLVLIDEKFFRGSRGAILQKSPPCRDNLAYVIYTSGTTGKPKGVMIAHYSLVNRLNWMQKKYPLDESDTIMHKTPFTFDVSVWEIFWWALTGSRLYLLIPGGEKEPGTIMEAVERNKVTVMHFVPSMLGVFLDYLKGTGKAKKLARLKRVIASGEALTVSHVKRFQQILRAENSTDLHNLYGPTEASIDVSYYDCFEKGEYGSRESIPIGKPIDNIRLYILDRYLRVQPVGISGELYIAGVGLAKGYLNRQELTAEKFVIGHLSSVNGVSTNDPSPLRLYRTSDLARWLADGNIEFLGRTDYQVKIRGFRIELGEIESRLLKHDKVKDAVVIDRQFPGESAADGKYLCAYVVSEDHLPSFLTELRVFLSQTLPNYMIPAYFIQVERIPLTPNGKVNRKALPDPEKQAGQEYVPPRSDLEEQLALIWEEILAVEKVGIRDNFFNIGGDSIRAIRLLSAVNGRLNIRLSAVDLVANETIEKLTDRIKQYKSTIESGERQKVLTEIEDLKTRIMAGNKLEGDIEDIYPMSDIEKGMVFYSLKKSNEAVYHDQFPYILDFHSFDPRVFREAAALMVEKHQVLRTTFDMDSFEEPVQIVYKNIAVNIQHSDISDMETSRQREYLIRYMEEDRKNPFNVYSPPLWRMRTFQLGNGKICAFWIFHHAILDGWSVASLMTELNNTYLNLKAAPEYRVGKLKISYKEFVVEQLLEKRKTENYQYWRQELEDYKRLHFPLLLESEKGQDEIKRYADKIGLNTLDALNKVAKEYNTGIKHLCFGAYLYMLNMLSYDNDVIAGLVTDNRPIAEDGDKVMGCFLNTVPVRIKIPRDITWSNYIEMIDKKLKELAHYNRLSLYEIVRSIGEKTQEQNPLFDTLFNYTDFHVYGGALRDEIENVKDREKETVDSFYLEVYENTNTLLDFTINTLYPDFSMYVSYTDSLIREADISKLCVYFKRILDKFMHEPESMVKKTDILPPEDKQQILYDFNDTLTAYSSDKTIHQLFEEQVERTPGNIAVIFNDHALNYKELNERANRLAWELRKKCVTPNRFVGVIMDRTIEMVIGVMAILKAGGAYVPIEPFLPDTRIATCLATVNSEWLLTNRMQLRHIGDICRGLPALKNIFCLDMNEKTELESDAAFGELFKEKILILNEDIANNSAKNPTPAAMAADIAYVIFTSGTTGMPKGVVEQHRPVVNIIEWVNKTTGASDPDKLLFVASLSFDLSVYDIFGILAVGGSVRVVSREDLKAPERLLAIIFEEGITYWDSAPAALQQLVPFLEELKETRRFSQESKLRIVLLSGDWIPLTMPGILKEVFPGVRVLGLGGGTEATIWSNFYLIGEVNPYWRSIPYGKPTQNAKYYILDCFLNPCPIGIAGDLYIGGQCLALGYINDIDLTIQKFFVNPFVPGERIYKTGDLARWYADGNMEFLGRQDSQVKIRGFRVELGEIESQLLKHEDIKEAVIVARQGKTNAKDDKYLCAYYVSTKEFTAAQLSDYLAQTLPEYMIPLHFLKLPKMPVTSNGKLDRKALPEPMIRAEVDQYIAPRDEVERKLVTIWSEVLGIPTEEISINANFFELGGHSLNATIMVPKVHKALNVRLPLSEVFITPTLSGLAEYIKRAEESLFTSIQPVEEKEYYPLSPAQKRMFLLNRLKGDETSDNTPFVIMFNTNLDIVRLKKVVSLLIERHETLRTSFEIFNDIPIQRVHKQVDFEIEYHDLSTFERDSTIVAENKIQEFIRPFDLSKAPLLRVGVAKLPGKKHLLMYDMHHIINDDISREIFIKESMNLFEGLELPPLKVQYKDFASWQNRQLESGVIKKQEEYWLNIFAGEIPVLNMPTDYPRPSIQSFEGKSFEYKFSSDVTKKIKQIMAEKEATLYMVLLAIYNILLSKYSGQEDLIVGSPAAGRPHTDLENLIGMFANTLALRNYPGGKKTFVEFLEEVKINSFRAFENQDYQFEDLVNQLGIKPDPSRNPLFDTMFTTVLEANAYGTSASGETKDASFRPYEFLEKVTQFDIIIHASDMNEVIGFYLRYSTKLFKEETVANLLHHFEEIADCVGTNINIRLEDIAITHGFSDAASSILEQTESDFAF